MGGDSGESWGVTGILAKGLRWIGAAVFFAVVFEVVTTATLERFNLQPPAAVRRAMCNECLTTTGRLDEHLASAALRDAGKFVAGKSDAELTAIIEQPDQVHFFDEAKRKALSKRIINNACRGKANPKACVSSVSQYKSQIVVAVVAAERSFLAWLITAAATELGKVTGRPVTLSPEFAQLQHSAAPEAMRASLCQSKCQVSSLLDIVLPPALLTDPRLEPILGALEEVWGTLLLLIAIGLLLVATLHIRATAAQRQHVLYLRLVSQFRDRVSAASGAPVGGAAGGASTAGPATGAPVPHGKTSSTGS